MNKFASLTALVFFFGLSACETVKKNDSPPLAGAKMGGAFSLIDQDGKPVTDQSYAGHYRLIYFGYTYCPDVCPVDVAALGKGLSQFEKTDPARGAKVQPIFITVDPARDTPTILKSFVANFHPRMVGLTGTEEQIAAVAQAYAVMFERGKPNDQGAYLVNHSRTSVLYGPDGRPITLVSQDAGPDIIADELARWVK